MSTIAYVCVRWRYSRSVTKVVTDRYMPWSDDALKSS